MAAREPPPAFSIPYFLVAERIEEGPDGRLTAREALNHLTFPRLPGELRVQIAASIVAATEDGLADHVLGCRVVHPDGVVEKAGGDLAMIELQPTAFGLARRRMIANIHNFMIRQPGLLRLALVIDDAEVAYAPFEVRLEPGEAEA